MPFLSPSAARVPPLSFLLADQTEPPRRGARHLGVSLRTLQRYAASGVPDPVVRGPRGALRPARAGRERGAARPRVGRLARARVRVRVRVRAPVIRAYEHAQARPAANAPAYHSV